ncbi:WYL domain-containing protein [Caenimonas koreensis DSM 17982]|uniref:WYL domain-containing protein n=1 Tax=Caenimonas koreensis DSM 17982 TaxID=1121255 RepID=A0A844ASL4_9BURK|nr:YafY family protein [Caenimonas koreensis]MRD47440.1 WYL domain-containing protein [Caenimonas koreensis DSM 17982]
MSEFVRLFEYKQLLSGRRAVPRADIIKRLEISPATFKRDIAKMRDQLHVPIKFDRDRDGYYIDQDNSNDNELPGLWFTQQEILALVTVQQLLSSLEPGLLGPKLKPLQARLEDLMDKHGLKQHDIAARLRIVHAGKRQVPPQLFEQAAHATMARKRLAIHHMNRQTGETQEREISPQRLVHYRDNWYVDAWCHLRDDLRSFSIDAISAMRVLEEQAKEVDPKAIDDRLGASYGIFGGKPKAWATLKFTPQRARWVKGERWHPMQESRVEADGSYVLSVPYADDRELVGDILRFGADVQVLGPLTLKRKVSKVLLESLALGIGDGGGQTSYAHIKDRD